MKIAVVTLDFPPSLGGVQEYLGQLARRIGVEHELTVWAPPPLRNQPVAGHMPYQRYTIPRTALATARVLKRWQADRVIVGHAHFRLLLSAWLAAPDRYLTIAYGNDFLSAQRRWYRPLFNRLLARSRPLISISHSSARRLHGLGMPEPVVIHPGTDPQRFHPPDVPPPPPYTLLSVGRLVPRKGLDTALRALVHLRRDFPRIQYLIAGRGPERRHLQRLAQKLGLGEAVHFLGTVPDEDLPALYRRAHLFVLPMREEARAGSVEGFGIIFLEAAATAVPSVAGDSGGVAEAVRDGETGLLVAPDNVDALCAAISTLLKEPEQRLRMGATGRRWVEEVMNWDRVAREFSQWLI